MATRELADLGFYNGDFGPSSCIAGGSSLGSHLPRWLETTNSKPQSSGSKLTVKLIHCRHQLSRALAMAFGRSETIAL